MKARAPRFAMSPPIAGKMLAMIFDKPSTRTRVSFDVAMRQLGGETIVLTGQEMQLGRGETVADTARVLSRYVDAIMIRTLEHGMLLELAQHATVPVINGLTRRSHPCQIMADVMTFEEHSGPIRGRKVAWTGDANNVLTSWMHAARQFDFELAVATPPELAPKRKVLEWVASSGARIEIGHDPEAAVAGADCRRDRHLGVDGRQGRRAPAQSAAALPGQQRPHGKSEVQTPYSCIACRRIAATKSPTRSSTARNRWCSTRPKIACTPRRASWRGASTRVRDDEPRGHFARPRRRGGGRRDPAVRGGEPRSARARRAARPVARRRSSMPTPIRRRSPSCSARRSCSRCCSAPRSSSTAASSCRPRPTARCACWWSTTAARGSCAPAPSSTAARRHRRIEVGGRSCSAAAISP